jgi:hypothetical protein
MILPTIAVTACGASSVGGSGAPTASATVSTAASAQATLDCTSQAISWRDGGGGTSQLSAIATDLGNYGTAATSLGQDLSSGADPTSDESAMQTAAGALQADVQAAQSNLPPSCVPNLHQDESAALTDLNKAAIDAGQSVSELTNGSIAVSDADLQAANDAVVAGTTKLSAAVSDASSFSG